MCCSDMLDFTNIFNNACHISDTDQELFLFQKKSLTFELMTLAAKSAVCGKGENQRHLMNVLMTVSFLIDTKMSLPHY